MNEIICPNCKKAFKVDEAGFADILKQVRDQQFEEELQTRLHLADKDKVNAIKLAEAHLKNAFQEDLTKKNQEISELKARNVREMAAELNKKDAEISTMKSKIDMAEMDKKLSVSEALKAIEKERDSLANAIKNKETEKQLLEKSLYEKFTVALKTKDDIIKLSLHSRVTVG